MERQVTHLQLLAQQTIAISTSIGYNQESEAGVSAHAHVQVSGYNVTKRQ